MRSVNAFLASSALSIACSSPSTPVTTVAPARAVLTSRFGPGTEAGINDASKCQVTTQDWASIGDNAYPVDDGQSFAGSTVSVSCSVKPEGDGFAVDGSISVAGGGAVVLRGHFTPTATQTNVYAAFTRGLVGNFQENDCTAEYKNVPAAGRLWVGGPPKPMQPMRPHSNSTVCKPGFCAPG